VPVHLGDHALTVACRVRDGLIGHTPGADQDAYGN
jgi:hypothetical protein